MEIKKMQKNVVDNSERYGKDYDVKIDSEYALMKLFEEVGELSEAILTLKKGNRPEKRVSEKEAKDNIAKELADIIGIALLNADILGVDVEKDFKDKWIARLNERISREKRR